MEKKETILNYIEETYRPEAVIVYGSFANGTAGPGSDFDALVIADHGKTHDSSVIDGTVLDVFVYPPEQFRSDYDPEEFVQVWNGKIVLDRNGTAEVLQKRVRDFIRDVPRKSREEILEEILWCEKMLSRAARGDAEGYYRWHWLLADSLEVYSDMKGQYFFGLKKALRTMKESDPEAYGIYAKALREFTYENLSEWIRFLIRRGNAV